MSAAFNLPVLRFPDVVDCSCPVGGKCQNFDCRHSVLEGRKKLEQWDSEDLDELIDALPDTCSLALADVGGLTTEQVAALLGLPRDTVERTEAAALRKLSMRRELRRAFWDSLG